MDELCILFPYYRNDELTRHHLEQARRHNPGVPIIPLACGLSDPLPGTVDVAGFPQPWEPKAALRNPTSWRENDTMLYRWFLRRESSAQRYLLLEYDCLCTQPLRESYAEAWDTEVACAEFVTPQDTPQWYWFRRQELGLLDPHCRPFAAGVVPLAGVFFSHRALERIVHELSSGDPFCELRLGTAIRKAGLAVHELAPSPCRDLQWYPRREYPRSPGLFHPVKTLPGADHDPEASNPGPGVAWIASFPGSGESLARELLCETLLPGLTGPGAAASIPMLSDGPYFGLGDSPVINGYQLAATHWRFSGANPYSGRRAACLYVVRHPLRILEAHLARHAPETSSRDALIESFLDGGTLPSASGQGCGGWISHLQSWMGEGNPHPLLLLRYEDLVAQPRVETERMMDFVAGALDGSGGAAARSLPANPCANGVGSKLLTKAQYARFHDRYGAVVGALGYRA